MNTWHFPIAVAFALSVAAPALAADLPVYKEAPAPPPTFSWTGFYVDAGAGYGEWNADTAALFPGTHICASCETQTQGGHGFFGRAGAGFDYQFSDHLVAGVFGDGTFSGMRGTIQDQNSFLAGSINENWSWAAGGRLGWLITPELLAYGTAGFTQTHFTSASMAETHSGVFTGASTPGFTTDGWFVGGGVESMFAPGWFWRTEYRLADYGARDLTDSAATHFFDDIHFRPIVQTITSGLVYKFDWPSMAPPAFPALSSFLNGFGPAPVSASNWTGFYADAGIGYGLWSANTTTVNPVTGFCALCVNQRQGGRGVAGSVGLGFDYQFTNRLVAGVFGDFDPAALRGTIQDQTPPSVGTITENWAWSGGARLGWLVTPQILSYTDAGFTQARFSSAAMNFSNTGLVIGSTPGFTTNGWFLGGGFEAMFAPGWFLRTEYRWAEYGAKVLTDTSAIGTLDDIRFHPEVQTATVGLVYKFNWSAPAPIVAKY